MYTTTMMLHEKMNSVFTTTFSENKVFLNIYTNGQQVCKTALVNGLPGQDNHSVT